LGLTSAGFGEDAMTRTVGLIHAVIPAIAPLRAAFTAELPEVRVLNLLDEALLKEAERLGAITPGLVRRMTGLVALHESAGAELVLFTCNAYSPFVDQVRAQSGVPVLPIDEAMLQAALASGRRLGVLATVAAGLEQQRQGIDRVAVAAGKEVEVVPVLRTDAFAALNAGDAASHDRILLEELAQLAPRVDVVLLAQASMAGLVQKIPPETPAPVLSSPQLAVTKVKEMLEL
jgi:Asp/Glu/hydantoin racemase